MSLELSRLIVQTQVSELMYRYAQACDAGYDGRRAALLFEEDGTWENSRGLRLRGREEIEAHITESGIKRFSWAAHYLCNGVVETTGAGTAFGQWNLLQHSSLRPSGDISIANGIYSVTFRDSGSGWMLSKLYLQIDKERIVRDKPERNQFRIRGTRRS